MGVATARAVYEVSAIAVAWRMEDAFSAYYKGVFNTPCTGTGKSSTVTLHWKLGFRGKRGIKERGVLRNAVRNIFILAQ